MKKCNSGIRASVQYHFSVEKVVVHTFKIGKYVFSRFLFLFLFYVCMKIVWMSVPQMNVYSGLTTTDVN